MNRILSILAASAVLLCLCLACGGPHDHKAKFEATPAPAGVSEQDWVAAKGTASGIFEKHCALCHGTSGQGDGPTGKVLSPRPRNYTDAKWQATITDDRVEAVIKDGGGKHGLNVLMPPALPEFADKPLVIKALRAIVRSFAK
jgi:cytochrome c553